MSHPQVGGGAGYPWEDYWKLSRLPQKERCVSSGRWEPVVLSCLGDVSRLTEERQEDTSVAAREWWTRLHRLLHHELRCNRSDFHCHSFQKGNEQQSFHYWVCSVKGSKLLCLWKQRQDPLLEGLFQWESYISRWTSVVTWVYSASCLIPTRAVWMRNFDE